MTCETCLSSQIQSDQEGEELLQLGRSLYKEMARLGAGRGAGERDREVRLLIEAEGKKSQTSTGEHMTYSRIRSD